MRPRLHRLLQPLAALNRIAWHQPVLALASLILVAGCTVRFVGSSEGQPPAALYIFNVDPPESEVVIYRQVSKPRSLEQAWNETLGDSPYSLEQIASVSGQRYVQVSIPPGLDVLRVASAKQAFGRAEELNSNPIFANSSQTYYATVYSPSPSESTSAELSGLLIGLLFLGLEQRYNLPRSRQEGSSWGVRTNLISSAEAEDLMKRLKPQEMVQPPSTPLASRQAPSSGPGL